MIIVDTNSFDIAITRGDTATIVFSAKDEGGNTYVPVLGDSLKFSVAKKWGADPLFTIENVMAADANAFWSIVIDDTAWETAREAFGGDMKFGDYVYDVQLTTSTKTETIIGKTDELSPRFRVWGEVSE